jgi:sugar/nucleoside kinase (ribokinase family)
MKRIVCIGQSALDVTLPVDEYPKENTKVRIGDRRFMNGGGACNNATYLLGKWNDDVTLISTVGNDRDGVFLEQEMSDIGVQTMFAKIDSVPTTTSYIITSLSKCTRTIITNKSPLLKYNRSVNISCDYILVDGNDYETALKVFNDNPNAIKVIDAGRVNEGILTLSKYCDYVVCSNDFAKEYTKKEMNYEDREGLKEIYDQIQKDYKGLLIITLESYGCMVKLNNEFHFIPSIKVNTIDTNGAGDIFHGAFVHFLSNDFELLRALRLSNITGALSTTAYGTRKGIPDILEVMNYE